MAEEDEKPNPNYSDAAMKANQKRWDRFRNDENYDEMKRQIISVAQIANLDPKELGFTWGITVLVDKETMLRINHADYALFDVRDPNKPYNKRSYYLAYLPLASGSESFGAKIKRRALVAPYTKRRGFQKYVPGGKVAKFRADSFDFVLESPEIKSGVPAHVHARQRRLFGPSRHNPLTADLFR